MEIIIIRNFTNIIYIDIDIVREGAIWANEPSKWASNQVHQTESETELRASSQVSK